VCQYWLKSLAEISFPSTNSLCIAARPSSISIVVAVSRVTWPSDVTANVISVAVAGGGGGAGGIFEI
jgi:hypothetical protein